MIKKIIISVLVLGVLVLCGWKLFFDGSSVDKQLKDLNTAFTSYHMEANMEIGEGETNRNFYVQVDYKKDDKDQFRISLTDKDINQEQILLRNKEGVYVLTPVLNQVYTFKGDYPLSSPKPYLYQSIISSLDGEYDLSSVSDGYLLTFDVKYDNEPNWTKQEVKLSNDLKPVWTYIYDNENQVVVKVMFTKVEFETTFENDYFDVDYNMRQAKENISSSHVSTAIEDLPLISDTNSLSSTLKEQTKIEQDGVVSYILTYEGEKSYTVFQTLLTASSIEEYASIEVEGTFVDTLYGIGYIQGKCLNYLYHDVSYEIYSSDLSVSEMIDVVTNMEIEAVK